MKKKIIAPAPAPDLNARLHDAAGALASGLALFEEAALRLDEAQAAHAEIVAEAENKIADLNMVAAIAQANADRSARAAEKVRDLTA